MPIPTVFVTSPTGCQGGATAYQLRRLGWNVRGIVRDVASPKSQALQAAGVKLVLGDWDDDDALRAGLAGCDKVFVVFTASLGDREALPRWARRITSLSMEAGVRQAVVSSTLGTTELEPGHEPANPRTPGFANHLAEKHLLERIVEEAGFESWTVLRPGAFMTNLLLPKVQFFHPELVQKGKWASVMTPESLIGLVDHEYIAKFAVAAFSDPARFHGIRAGLVTDGIKVQDMLDQLAEAVGDGRTMSAHFMSDEEIDAVIASGVRSPLLTERNMRYMCNLVDTKMLEDLVPGLTTFKEFLEREKELVHLTYNA